MQPTVSENYGIAAYKPPPATIVVYPKAPFVPPARSELPSASIAVDACLNRIRGSDTGHHKKAPR
jgi:hypothetical protein